MKIIVRTLLYRSWALSRNKSMDIAECFTQRIQNAKTRICQGWIVCLECLVYVIFFFFLKKNLLLSNIAFNCDVVVCLTLITSIEFTCYESSLLIVTEHTTLHLGTLLWWTAGKQSLKTDRHLIHFVIRSNDWRWGLTRSEIHLSDLVTYLIDTK